MDMYYPSHQLSYGSQSFNNGLVVREATLSDKDAWDAFVRDAANGLPTHLFAWKEVITSTYGHSCHFLVAQEKGKVKGVLPLFLVSSPITGRCLQSMPGALCTKSPQVAEALIRAADELARLHRVDYLYLCDSRQQWPESGLDSVLAHRGVRLKLMGDSQTVWKSLRKDVRYHIRHGRKQGKTRVVVDQTRLHDFYSLFLNFTHQMGTPLFSLKFLKNTLKALPEESQIALAYYEDTPIAGYFNFVFQDKIIGMWGGALHSHRRLKATHQVYWTLIEMGCQKGCKLVDMGRSPYPSGTYKFKSQWGQESYPIYQLYRAYRGRTPPVLRASVPQQSGRSFELFRQVWRHLPLAMARVLGPQLRWHMPFA